MFLLHGDMTTTHRFFLPPDLVEMLRNATLGEILTITDLEMIHQWQGVLRLRKEETIVLLDNNGKEYKGEIKEITKKDATVKITEISTPTTEPQTKITVYQAIPKQLEKLEFVIQKGTELGAHAFVPLITERTLLRTISPQKMMRLRTIAKEAAEQSERMKWPHVSEPQKLRDVVGEIVKHTPHELMICTDARENKNQLKEFEILLRSTAKISIFIGPEGGLSSQEIDFLKQEGAQCIQLGPRILRTETAAPAILAALFVGGLVE